LLVNGHVYPEVDTQHLGSNFQEPRILYHNNGNGTFTDISANAGPGVTKASSSRGLAIGDLWNDGKLSAVVSNMNAPPSLLVNEVRSPNNWVAFRLTGSYPQATAPVAAENPAAARQPTRSTRDAIGARIKVKVGGRTLVDEVRSGSSFISNNDMRVHFGLGAATKIDSVEVRWPSGLSETFSKISVDRVNELKEGTGAAANEK
jgi:enediyne biosynthesis protein E4